MYEAINDEIQMNRKNKTRGGQFISDQYANLNSVLSSRQKVIDSLFRMKQVIQDFHIKYIKLNEGEGDDNNQDAILQQVLSMITTKQVDRGIMDEALAVNHDKFDTLDSDEIAAHLDSMFDIDEEGLVVDKVEEVVEDGIDIDVINKAMGLIDLKLVINTATGDLTVASYIPYGDSVVVVERDPDELEEDEPEIFEFLNNDDNFSVDTVDNTYTVPEGFTEYVIEDTPVT